MSNARQLTLALIAAGVLISTTACSPRMVSRGYFPDKEKIDAIAVGVDTKRSVNDRLGSPTLVSTFNADIWYYVTSREQQVAWRLPATIKQDVLEVHFAPNGQVSEIVKHDESELREVATVNKVTATRGRELSFWEQMFGSIGRGALGSGLSDGPGDRGGGGGRGGR